MSDWIEWEGGACPAGGKVKVEYVMRNGSSFQGKASDLDWGISGHSDDIVRYRVLNDEVISPAKKPSIDDVGIPVSDLNDGDKYLRTIIGMCGTPVQVDVYRVLDAFPIDSPALQHAAKKVLCAGERGHKDKITDYKNIIESAQKALVLLEQKELL